MTRQNKLFYGDNLPVMRSRLADESVDLCYIDPPFNSKRTYNQIYNRIGEEDRAQAQAFVDTWVWDDAAREGLFDIEANRGGLFTRQTIDLIRGLRPVLGDESLLAYIISITLRVVEIHRVLKRDGSFFLHCDPGASHYLKLVLDSVFLPQGGEYRNEIVWCYTGPGSPGMRQFMRKHDTIFWFSKSDKWTFNVDDVRLPHKAKTKANYKPGLIGSGFVGAEHAIHEKGKVPEDWWQIAIAPRGREYLGYPTQKPQALLERIIRATSSEGDTILDSYCGCGTTVYEAEALKRKWIGIDITFQSVSLVLRRLEKAFGQKVLSSIEVSGIPEDIESARALALKADDRLRKEFEKLAILTYTSNRGVVNTRKGADAGVDGAAYFWTGRDSTAKAILQVKSGNVGRGDIARLRGDMERERAEVAILITLEEPTAPMIREAASAGTYVHELTGRHYPRIRIVNVRELIEEKARLELPLSIDPLRAPTAEASDEQQRLL